jgi:hypothetical protein
MGVWVGGLQSERYCHASNPPGPELALVMDKPEKDQESFLDQATDPTRCFLCGASVDVGTRSQEHVFAQWLLDRYNLRREQLTLPNGTYIFYEQLTVTACIPCNSGPLSRLEKEIGDAFRLGPDAVRSLDPERLFLWLAKFYYGIRFRELTLPIDRRDPNANAIVSNQMIRQFPVHHLLLKRLLNQVTWTDFPASIFIYECLVDSDPKKNFDYFDAQDQPYVSVRIGSTYVAAFLQDFGAVKQYGVGAWEIPKLAAEIRLHPLQVIELDSLFYTVLKNHRPATMMVNRQDDQWNVMVMPRGGLSGRPPFQDWSAEEYLTVQREMFRWRAGTEMPSTESGIPTLFRRLDGSVQQAPDTDWSYKN